MPKKVLILTATIDDRPFAGSAHEAGMTAGIGLLGDQLTDGVEFCIAAVNELLITVTDSSAAIQDTRNGCDLRSYDLVRFINVTRARDHFQAVGFYLAHYNIPVVEGLDVQGTPFGKISQMVRFALSGIAVPDTIAVWNSELYLSYAREHLPLPCICKANHGTKGQDNFLVQRWKDLEDILHERGQQGFVLQPFIPNDGDYRVLYMGAQRLIFYRQAAKGSHLNNASQSGKGTLLAPEDCPPEVLDLAAKAYQAYGRQIGGVDVLVNRETNEPCILEVNDTPAIFGGLFPDVKAKAYAAFFADTLQDRKPTEKG
jgi:glutathione synthase/RimK-type ligase-like ATP-grasp enzyme